MFSKNEVTEVWIDEQCQRTSNHKITIKGPVIFSATCGSEKSYIDKSVVTWHKLGGSQGRYDIGFNVKKKLKPEENDGKSFLCLHIRQNRRTQEAKGVDIKFWTQIYGADKSTMINPTMACDASYAELAANSWFFQSVPSLFSNSELTFSSSEFVSVSDVLENASIGKQNKFYILLKIQVAHSDILMSNILRNREY